MLQLHKNTVDKMYCFVGKICTILTTTINREFSELQAREHFVIRVSEINPDGVWGNHPQAGTTSFFTWEHIASIQEEIELDPDNPEHAEMLLEYEKETGKKIESDLNSKNYTKTKKEEPPVQESHLEQEAQFINIDNLTKLAVDTKKSFEKS